MVPPFYHPQAIVKYAIFVVGEPSTSISTLFLSQIVRSFPTGTLVGVVVISTPFSLTPLTYNGHDTA